MISENMLRNNYLLNVNILECLKRGSAEVLFESMDSILIKDNEAKMYLISAESKSSAKNAIRFIPKTAKLILAHQGFYCDSIIKKCGFKDNTLTTYHVVWTKKEHVIVPRFEGKIKKLTLENMMDIKENYKLFNLVGEESVKESILKGRLIGAFIDGELCGFIGQHEEGSIGMLQVFKRYRRRGIGYILQALAINKALDEGRTPFGEVVIDNKASLNLQKKMGLEISKDKLYWLE